MGVVGGQEGVELLLGGLAGADQCPDVAVRVRATDRSTKPGPGRRWPDRRRSPPASAGRPDRRRPGSRSPVGRRSRALDSRWPVTMIVRRSGPVPTKALARKFSSVTRSCGLTLWSMVLRSTSALPIGVGRDTRSAGMTVPGCRSGPASVTGCRSRYCSPSAESSLTRTGPLSGMCSPALIAQFDGHVPRVEIECRDCPHLHPPVGHIGARVQAAGARHQDGDRERLGGDVVLQDVEGDVVDADDDDDGQGDHSWQEVCFMGPRS